MVPQLIGGVRRVDEHGGPFFGFAEHVVLIQEVKHMHADKVGRLDEVRRADVVFAKADVRCGHRAGFFGIVHKVPLGKKSVGADDLHRVLVGPHRPVGTQTVEQGGEDILAGFVVQLGRGQGRVGQIIVNANGEILFGCGQSEVVKHGLDVRGGEVFRTNAVASADDKRRGREFGLGFVGQESGADILEQRFAQGARLFGAVQYGHLFNSVGNDAHKVGNREGAEQFYFQYAHFFAFHGFGGDLRHIRARAHDDDQAFRVGVADVLEQVVLAARELFKRGHFFFDHGGHGIIKFVDGFAGLEVHVRVGGGAAHGRVFRV